MSFSIIFHTENIGHRHFHYMKMSSNAISLAYILLSGVCGQKLSNYRGKDLPLNRKTVKWLIIQAFLLDIRLLR